MRVFSSISWALAEPVAGDALALTLNAEDGAIAGHSAQLRHHVGEGPHVGGLLLDPDDLLG